MTTTATAPPRPPGSPPNADTPTGVAAVEHALARLIGADLSAVDRDELAALMAESSRIHGWLDSFDIATARRARELADAGRAEGPISMLGREGRRSSRDAARIDERAEVLDGLGEADGDGSSGSTESGPDHSMSSPDSFEAALRDGRLSHGHVDALADAMRRLDGDARTDFERGVPQLLTAALVEPVEVFERRCRSLARRIVTDRAASDADELARQQANSKVKRWVDKITGMHHTHLELDPIRDSQLWSVVNAALTTMVHDTGNAAVRKRLGMPQRYGSCHTATVGGSVLEGHVPVEDIRRLLGERPADVVGLAGPGMPVGAPGMDGPIYGGRRDPYDVLRVRRDVTAVVARAVR